MTSPEQNAHPTADEIEQFTIKPGDADYPATAEEFYRLAGDESDNREWA